MSTAINQAFASLRNLYAFNELLLTVPALENTFRTIMQANQRIIRNVVDASKEKLTSYLLLVKDLLHALNIGENEYKLTPIFNGA